VNHQRYYEWKCDAIEREVDSALPSKCLLIAS